MNLKTAARWLALGIAVTAVSAGLAGCAKPPQQAIDAVASEVERLAADPDAATYAPDALRQAEDCLGRLQDEVAAQAGKLAVFRRYDAATALADETSRAVDAARAATIASKESVRAEAEKVISDVTGELPTVERKAVTARRLRGSKLDSAAVGRSFAEVRSMLDGARVDLEAGSFAPARAKANTAQDCLTELALTLDQAILLGRGR